MFLPSRVITRFLLACAAVLPLRAAERVTLRSGFTVTCTAHEALAESTVRLYLAGESGSEKNYLDVPARSIATVETIAEPLPELIAATPPKSEQPMAALLQQSGAKHNLNVELLASVVQAESAGNPHAVSRAGAGGLMQLMPVTAAKYQLADRFSPEGNVNAGSAYLSELLTRYHENLALALAAYNAGPAAVDRYHGVPPFRETQAYVARVIRAFNRRVLAEQHTSR